VRRKVIVGGLALLVGLGTACVVDAASGYGSGIYGSCRNPDGSIKTFSHPGVPAPPPGQRVTVRHIHTAGGVRLTVKGHND
jgi:hypothetical protein